MVMMVWKTMLRNGIARIIIGLMVLVLPHIGAYTAIPRAAIFIWNR